MSDFLKINVDEHDDESAQQALPVADVGELLRTHRLKRNLSQEEVASELRMDVRQLDALENNRFDVFSGTVFVQGYLRNYAKLLDLDPAPIIDEFNKVSKTTPPEIVAIKKVMTSAGGAAQIPLSQFTPVVLGIVALALILWLGDNLYGFIKEVTKTSEIVETESGLTEIDVLDRFQEAQERLSADAGTSTLFDESEQPEVLTSEAQTDFAPSPIEAGVDQLPELDSVGAFDLPEVRVVFRFREDSWIEVFDANDTRLLARIGAAGTEKVITGTPPLRVVLGNAPAVDVEFEGKPYTLRVNPNTQVARFNLGQVD